MAISLSAIMPYLNAATSPASNSGQASASSSSSNTPGSVGSMLETAAMSVATSGLQDLVTLGSLQGGTSSDALQTYNALGLLSGGSALLPGTQSDGTDSTALSSPASSSGSTDSQTPGSADINSNLASVLQQNPSYANTIAEETMNEGIISMFQG